MYTLELADGSTVEISMAGVGQQGDLWVHAHGLTLAECVAIFSDPQKTSRMRVEYDKTINDTFEGFTNIFSVSDAGGFMRVGIARGVENA